MPENKLCPMSFNTKGEKGDFDADYCIKEKCAWWDKEVGLVGPGNKDEKNGRCLMVTLVRSLQDMKGW